MQSLAYVESGLDAAYQALDRSDVEQAKLEIMRAKSHLFVVSTVAEARLTSSHPHQWRFMDSRLRS